MRTEKRILIISFTVLSVLLVGAKRGFSCCDDPIAKLSVDHSTVCVGCSVTFDATGSYDPDCSTCSSCGGLSMKKGIRKFEWDWTNNGTYDYNETPGDGKASHTYSTAGTYTCKLRVTDNDNSCCCSGATCDDKTDTDTVTVTVVDLTQFNADPTKFPICQNESISSSDFVIITDPSGHESDVTVSGLTTASSGAHTATAQLCINGCCASPSKTANYNIVASGTWTPVPATETIPPSPPTGSINSSNTSIDLDPCGPWFDVWYKTKVTYIGGYSWYQIGQGVVAAPGTFSTSQSKKWTISGSVAGTAEVGIPMVAGAKVSVTVGGSWETSTTHTLTSGPDAVPYDWRYTHYQTCWGPVKIVQTWMIVCTPTCDPNMPPAENSGDWVSYIESGFSGTFPLAVLQGTNTYKQTKEKKCL